MWNSTTKDCVRLIGRTDVTLFSGGFCCSHIPDRSNGMLSVLSNLKDDITKLFQQASSLGCFFI